VENKATGDSKLNDSPVMSVNKQSVINNKIVEWVAILFDIPDKELEKKS